MREDPRGLDKLPEGVDEETLELVSWEWEDELECKGWMWRKRSERREIEDVEEFRKARKKKKG